MVPILFNYWSDLTQTNQQKIIKRNQIYKNKPLLRTLNRNKTKLIISKLNLKKMLLMLHPIETNLGNIKRNLFSQKTLLKLKSKSQRMCKLVSWISSSRL